MDKKVLLFANSGTDRKICRKYLKQNHGLSADAIESGFGSVQDLLFQITIYKPSMLVVRSLECLGDMTDALIVHRCLKVNGRPGKPIPLICVEDGPQINIFKAICRLIDQSDEMEEQVIMYQGLYCASLEHIKSQ